MRNVLRFLWMALVLLIVALISALAAMRLAIHGREVAVPDLQGKSPVEARRMLEDAGLAAQVERAYYSPRIPEGKVLSQMPPAGTVVRRGWEVRLALSLGPQRVVIPQVVGESERAADINIAQRGLDLGATARVQISGVTADQVVAQNPPANASDVSEPKISLLVAQTPSPPGFVMPSFIGHPLGSVSIALQSAGFTVGKVLISAPAAPLDNAPTVGQTNPSSASLASTASTSPATSISPSPASIIVAQDPAPGAKVVAATSINFTIR
jgi:eukaryotic-like serine/threonine-protein kinase